MSQDKVLKNAAQVNSKDFKSKGFWYVFLTDLWNSVKGIVPGGK